MKRPKTWTQRLGLGLATLAAGLGLNNAANASGLPTSKAPLQPGEEWIFRPGEAPQKQRFFHNDRQIRACLQQRAPIVKAMSQLFHSGYPAPNALYRLAQQLNYCSSSPGKVNTSAEAVKALYPAIQRMAKDELNDRPSTHYPSSPSLLHPGCQQLSRFCLPRKPVNQPSIYRI
jgi:hypothetical protein